MASADRASTLGHALSTGEIRFGGVVGHRARTPRSRRLCRREGEECQNAQALSSRSSRAPFAGRFLDKFGHSVTPTAGVPPKARRSGPSLARRRSSLRVCPFDVTIRPWWS